MLILILEMQKHLVYWRKQVKTLKATERLVVFTEGQLCYAAGYRQNILIGPDGFYGENKCTSWALGTRQSQKAGRRENGLIIEVSRRWPQSSYFLTPAINVSLWQFVQQIAAQAHSSSFHFPCNIWFGPGFEGSSEHCEEFHFYFPTCHLSSNRSLPRSIFLSQTPPPPPSGPLDTTDAHRQSSKTDCALKTRWKNGSLPCSEYESNS